MRSSSTVGTEASGARSVRADTVRGNDGRVAGSVGSSGGELGIRPVEEVGTGVGYLRFSSRCSRVLARWDADLEGESRATRFNGRGSGGDEEYSNAGSSDAAGAGRLTPATGEGTEPDILRGWFSRSLSGDPLRPASRRGGLTPSDENMSESILDIGAFPGQLAPSITAGAYRGFEQTQNTLIEVEKEETGSWWLGAGRGLELGRVHRRL